MKSGLHRTILNAEKGGGLTRISEINKNISLQTASKVDLHGSMVM